MKLGVDGFYTPLTPALSSHFRDHITVPLTTVHCHGVENSLFQSLSLLNIRVLGGRCTVQEARSTSEGMKVNFKRQDFQGVQAGDLTTLSWKCPSSLLRADSALLSLERYNKSPLILLCLSDPSLLFLGSLMFRKIFSNTLNLSFNFKLHFTQTWGGI